MDYTNDLYELCETISKEIGDANEKIRSAGKLSAGDVDYIDKLTHTLKSVKSVIAMMDSEYSNSMGNGMDGSYRYSGRGSYARNRDSMGRYSNRGYSRNADLVDQLHAMMQDAPESVKRDIQRLAEKIDQM